MESLEEMDKCLERYSFIRMNQKQRENMIYFLLLTLGFVCSFSLVALGIRLIVYLAVFLVS